MESFSWFSQKMKSERVRHCNCHLHCIKRLLWKSLHRDIYLQSLSKIPSVWNTEWAKSEMKRNKASAQPFYIYSFVSLIDKYEKLSVWSHVRM